MFIYNVTTHVHHAIHKQWLQWMQEKHIPNVMATECFSKHQFVRVLETDESEGVTYAIQYFAESKALYNRYVEKFSATLKKETTDKWGNQIVAFRSLMQVVN